jgi:hypothetical protein
MACKVESQESRVKSRTVQNLGARVKVEPAADIEQENAEGAENELTLGYLCDLLFKSDMVSRPISGS